MTSVFSPAWKVKNAKLVKPISEVLEVCHGGGFITVPSRNGAQLILKAATIIVWTSGFPRTIFPWAL